LKEGREYARTIPVAVGGKRGAEAILERLKRSKEEVGAGMDLILLNYGKTFRKFEMG